MAMQEIHYLYRSFLAVILCLTIPHSEGNKPEYCPPAKKTLMCVYSPKKENFDPSMIKTDYCTDIMYNALSFKQLSKEEPTYMDDKKYGFPSLLQLVEKKPSLKIWSNVWLADLPGSREIAEVFFQGLSTLLQKYKLRGLIFSISQNQDWTMLKTLVTRLIKILPQTSFALKIIDSVTVDPGKLDVQFIKLNFRYVILSSSSQVYRGSGGSRHTKAVIQAPFKSAKLPSFVQQLARWSEYFPPNGIMGTISTRVTVFEFGVPVEELLNHGDGQLAKDVKYHNYKEYCKSIRGYTPEKSAICNNETFYYNGKQFITLDLEDQVTRKAQYLYVAQFGGVMFSEINYEVAKLENGCTAFNLLRKTYAALCPKTLTVTPFKFGSSTKYGPGQSAYAMSMLYQS